MNRVGDPHARKPGQSEADWKLVRDNANYRRRLQALQQVAGWYQEREVRRLLAGVMEFELFQEFIGVEHVIDADGMVNLAELAARVNAKHDKLPTHIPERVSVQELQMTSKLEGPGCGQVCDRASGRQSAPGEQRGRASGRTEDLYPGGL